MCKKKVKDQNRDLERARPGWRTASPQRNASFLRFFQLGKTLKIPVIKFLLHSASYLWFLITLLGESITMELYRDVFASRQQNILHSSFHMVWVVGGSLCVSCVPSSALSHPVLSVAGSGLSVSLFFSRTLSRSLFFSLTCTLSLTLTHSHSAERTRVPILQTNRTFRKNWKTMQLMTSD